MAKKILDTKKATHEEWLKMRRTGIGGSDAGTIMNVNPYASLLSLYADKKGLSKDEEVDNEAMRVGRDLEAYVAGRYMEEMGKKIHNDNYMYQHDDYDFIVANIDRKIVGENAGVEIKTMSSFNKYDLDNGDVPPQYKAQCQHYMMVMGFDYMDLAIYVFQRGLFINRIDRDESYIRELMDKEIYFWEHYIDKDIEPEPDGSEASAETIKNMYPESFENTEIKIPGIDDLIAEHRFLKGQEKELKDDITQVENKIKWLMGDHELALGDKYSCSWKTSISNRVDTDKLKELGLYTKCLKQTSSRRLTTRQL